MPPPRLGRKPYDRPDDPATPRSSIRPIPGAGRSAPTKRPWNCSRGFCTWARNSWASLRHLGRGEAAHGIARYKLRDNPYWPRSSTARRRRGNVTSSCCRWPFPHPGRQGPRPLDALRGQRPGAGPGVLAGIFRGARGGNCRPNGDRFPPPAAGRPPMKNRPTALADLQPGGLPDLPSPDYAALAGLAGRGSAALLDARRIAGSRASPLRGVRYLLTFRPFGVCPPRSAGPTWPASCTCCRFRAACCSGARRATKLAQELPLAVQIPLLHSLDRHEAPCGLRVPQSGWLHEPRPGQSPPRRGFGPLRNTFRRTHRWARVHRHEDELADVSADEDSWPTCSSAPRPTTWACTASRWPATPRSGPQDFRLLLDGPRAMRASWPRAAEAVAEGGLFGYRFFYPPMRVGRHEVFWHRPLVACLAPQNASRRSLLPTRRWAISPPSGPSGRGRRPVELWPRLSPRAVIRRRSGCCSAATTSRTTHKADVNVRKVLETWELLGRRPLPPSFARSCSTLPKHESLDDWLVAAETRRRRTPSRPGELIEPMQLPATHQLDVCRRALHRPLSRKGDGTSPLR